MLQHLTSGLVGGMTMACWNGLLRVEKSNIWITHDGSVYVHINTLKVIVRFVLIWMTVWTINGLLGIVMNLSILSAKRIFEISFAIIGTTRFKIIKQEWSCWNVSPTIHWFYVESIKYKGITKWITQIYDNEAKVR